MNLKIIKNAKISVKLTIIYAFMFTLILIALNASVLHGIRYYLYSQGSRQLEDIQTIILNKIASLNEPVDLTDKKILSDVPLQENISIRIMQEDGTVLSSSEGFNYSISTRENYGKIKRVDEREKPLLYKNIKIQDNEYGKVYLQIVKDMHNEYFFLKILFFFIAVADFLGIIASIIIGYLISKRMLKPIDHITETAQHIGINNLKERIEVKGPEDELKRLGDTFNRMIDRLQDSFNKQVQFVSDASHELRTPIAVIQGYANLLDRWGKDDRQALEKSIYAIKLEAASMGDLVEKLLFLAKGDSGTVVIERKEFWLNELIIEVVEESRLISKNHVISNSKNDLIQVLGDYKMIKQMLRILIDNSIKFTAEKGIIDIRAELQEENVKITVADSGIGIQQDEIRKIFDRFYTVDKSRSRDKGGTGLGLSIAKWIVDMHQGTIEVESEEGKGTKIIVTLKTKGTGLLSL